MAGWNGAPGGGRVMHAALACAIGMCTPLSAQRITGIVLDQRTRAPVAGVEIRLLVNGQQATTNEGGAFRFEAVPSGRQMLQFHHIAYGLHSLEVVTAPDSTSTIRVLLAETAIVLEPLNVAVLSAQERRERSAGFRRNLVTREQIAAIEATTMRLVDVLRATVPSVRVRRVERVVGTPICVELRTLRDTFSASCLSPAVYLDGVPIVNPTWLYDNLDVSVIESMEVIPAAEAGVRFGSGALYGALLIETIRPGRAREPEDDSVRVGIRSFDWRMDQEGHDTERVFLAAAAGNLAGLGVGVWAARRCLRLRTPSYDGLVSDCETLVTLGSGVAALLLPALGSSLASRLSGRTMLSQGRFAPATVAGAMTVLPGFALVLTGYRNNSDGLKWVGYGLLTIGPPVLATASDYLFRRIREP
jgi:hypothetical protein